jgi:hypothetical protein
MGRSRSNCFALVFFIGFGLSSNYCVAEPDIDADVVLQVCRAFIKNAPEQMPAIVSPEAAKKFADI